MQELHKLSDSHPENQRIIGRNRLVLEGVVHVLQNGNPKSKLWCCAVLVNLAYRSEENTAKIGSVKGILSGLLKALRTRGTELTRADRCQQEACGALSNIAFSNALNSLAIARTSGMLETLVRLVAGRSPDDCGPEDHLISDDTKAEAALVLSNCAANSREAAELTVSCHGAVDSLKSLFRCLDVEAKRTAVGVFGNLSKCEWAATILRNARVREEVLLPALSAGDVGAAEHRELSEQELSVLSMRASAMMALTRLSTYSELAQLKAEDSMLHTIILILKRAINNQTWASINWQLPSPLNALALLTINPHNVRLVRILTALE